MAYPGLTFAILVGIAIGTAFYYYFNQEDDQQQRQQGYQYSGGDDTSDYDPWTDSRSTSSSDSRRRRRNSLNKCSICLDNMNRGRIKTLAECGHEFHERCLTVWIRQKKICPNCRGPVHL